MSRREQRAPTMRDVAESAGVALMTVSRFINNLPIRAGNRASIEAAIAKLGYQQNDAARMMKGQRSKTIGLIVPDLSDQFFASCAHTIQQVAREHGYMTLVVSSERDVELEMEQAQLMASRMIAGMVIVPSGTGSDARLRRMQRDGMAIVALDRPLAGGEADAVVSENRSGAEEATEHLIQHGHKRIACVGYDGEVHAIRERVTGFKTQMFSHALKPQIDLDLWTLDNTRDWVRKVMASKDRPTAVFAMNHRSTVFLLQAFSEQRVNLPQDMALVGFDDFELAELSRIGLTTVAQSPVELARRSINLLLERIQDVQEGASFTPAKISLPTKLIIRSSCGSHQVARMTGTY